MLADYSSEMLLSVQSGVAPEAPVGGAVAQGIDAQVDGLGAGWELNVDRYDARAGSLVNAGVIGPNLVADVVAADTVGHGAETRHAWRYSVGNRTAGVGEQELAAGLSVAGMNRSNGKCVDGPVATQRAEAD